MNEFNVLLGAATNGTPSGSLFDALFARYIAPQESWRELESPLPITILSAGEDLIDYRIYGNTVQTGTPTPENPIMPIGCGERTENLWDGTRLRLNKYIDVSGNEIVNYSWDITDYIAITNGDYIVSNIRGTVPAAGFYDADKSFISAIRYSTTAISNVRLTAPTNTAFLRLSVPKTTSYAQAKYVMLTEGSTPPDHYIPYGYKLPMVVTNGTTTTTTPIYIGSDPLAEDEYVDFGEQKVYRMEGGTLTPTDPPTPIPALSTIRGETIIDYNPSETPAVEPEKMYVKYKP